MSRRLLIFDIDGTLLHTGGAGMRAFKRAAEAVLGAEIKITANHFAGKLDCLIFKNLYADYAGCMGLRESWERFQELYLRYMAEESRDCGTWKVYPGVREFLDRERSKNAFALLTGNIRKGADIKLSTLGLDGYFQCGAFGENAESRSHLARQAIDAAEAHFGRRFADVWVIGDTIADIECGKSIGAKTIGVRTGFSKEGELEAAGADMVVRTLDEATL